MNTTQLNSVVLQPPFGVLFQPPAAWKDTTYYCFTQQTPALELVITEPIWAPNDPNGWLEDARTKMEGYSPAPIRHYPHSELSVQGFALAPPHPGALPPLHVFALAWPGGLRALSIAGPCSELEVEQTLQTIHLSPSGDVDSNSYWAARGLLVERLPGRVPPTRFGFDTRKAVLRIAWDTSREFELPNLTPFIDESDTIRQSSSLAYDVAQYSHGVGRYLVPERLGLGPHCFVAQAILGLRQSDPLQTSNTRLLHVQLVGDGRHVVNLKALWDNTIISTQLLIEGG